MTKASHKVLVLRGSNKDRSSTYDPRFIYPKKGKVVAPKWDPAPECGRGLHGFVWGTGDGGLLRTGGIYQIISVDSKDIVDLGTKVKFKKGEVVLTTKNMDKAIKYLLDNGAKGLPVMFSTNTGGYDSVNTGGSRSVNTGGDFSVNTGGRDSENTGGLRSKNTGGDCSENTGGDFSTNTGGYGSINTGGSYSVNVGGIGAWCSGGIGSSLAIMGMRVCGRARLFVAYVGENGILPNVVYTLDDNNNFVPASNPQKD
jgi:hypothetical protein